jgi:hypothetical protein
MPREERAMKKVYNVLFRLSNGRYFHAQCDHVPEFGVVVRIPGTELYGEAISLEAADESGRFAREE